MMALHSSLVQILVGAFALALLLCAAILYTLLRSGLALRLAPDIPNHRSLHSKPIPRVGGWGVVPVSVMLIVLFAPTLRIVAASALILAAVSHLDDRYDLPAHVRFIVHILAVAMLLAAAPPIIDKWWLLPIGVALVWLINLYNFMDGADGLAGGMTVFGFLAYTCAAAGKDHQLACASIVVAGAAAGFLTFNMHPARLFLGDSGSIPLGFLAGAVGYWGWREQLWAMWFPAMLFAPFIADASLTLLRRLFRGEKVWHAHREHYYQRMIQMGAGHRLTALVWYVAMAVGTALALWVRYLPPQERFILIGCWIAILLTCGRCIDQRWMQFSQRKASH